MKYSGYIDGLLAEAAFAKKTGDDSWLRSMQASEDDPIKIKLLDEVCKEEFMDSVKRTSEWFREQKNRLECIALDQQEEDETDRAIERYKQQQEEKKKKEDEGNSGDETDEDIESFMAKNFPDLESLLEDTEELGDESGVPLPLDTEKGSPDDDTDPEGRRGKPDEDDKEGGKSADDKKNESESQSDWEKMRSEALQKYMEQLDQAQMEKAMSESQNPEQSEPSSYMKGMANDVLTEMENETLRRIPKSLKRLARMIGRTGGVGVELGRTFSRASKSDISGITIGDDLNSLLPSEIAVLSDRRTEDIFYKNFAEKRLQVFASASAGEKKRERQDGPVIICLDTSSSMNGEPAKIAKMLTIAVSIYAMRRRRKVFVIKYSNEHTYQTFTRRGADRQKLMDFLHWKGCGGNNENDMFKDLFINLLPQETEFTTADILCISDFGWTILDKEVEELIQKEKDKGMIFYGLAVGAGKWMGFHHEDSINYCDSKWQWINGECVNIDDKYAKGDDKS